MPAVAASLRSALGLASLILGACAAPSAPPPTDGAASADPSGAGAPPSASQPAPSVPSPAPSSPAPPAWHQLAVDGPAAREDHTWTLRGDGAVAYLFGGRDGAEVMGDL